jgi:membrane dipeptidase
MAVTTVGAGDPADDDRVARDLIERAIVWDSHSCLSFDLHDASVEALARPRSAGFSFVSLNIGDAEMTLEQVTRIAGHYRSWIGRHADEFMLVDTVRDVVRAKAENRMALAFDLEGAFALAGDIEQVKPLYQLGVRWMSMAFNTANWVGAGCHDDLDGGLTEAGKALITEMDRVGMVKCCSHTGYRTSMDVLTRSDAPVVFSHSNAHEVHAHPRNVPDELILACAATDGVIGINGLSIFLGDGDTPVQLMANHIDHIAQLVGVRHVGLGLDYVYDLPALASRISRATGTWPKGHGYGSGIEFVSPEQLPALVEVLLQRGYADTDITAILGGNFMRVAEVVWNPVRSSSA